MKALYFIALILVLLVCHSPAYGQDPGWDNNPYNMANWTVVVIRNDGSGLDVLWNIIGGNEHRSTRDEIICSGEVIMRDIPHDLTDSAWCQGHTQFMVLWHNGKDPDTAPAYVVVRLRAEALTSTGQGSLSCGLPVTF